MWGRLLLLGVLGVALNQLLFNAGIARSTAIHAVLLMATVPAQTLALARKLGMQVVVPAFDGAGRPHSPQTTGGFDRCWLRVDGAGPTARLRGILSEALAHAISSHGADPVVLFAGPRAYANLRAFATEVALNEEEAEDDEDMDEDEDDEEDEDERGA